MQFSFIICVRMVAEATGLTVRLESDKNDIVIYRFK